MDGKFDDMDDSPFSDYDPDDYAIGKINRHHMHDIEQYQIQAKNSQKFSPEEEEMLLPDVTETTETSFNVQEDTLPQAFKAYDPHVVPCNTTTTFTVGTFNELYVYPRMSNESGWLIARSFTFANEFMSTVLSSATEESKFYCFQAYRYEGQRTECATDTDAEGCYVDTRPLVTDFVAGENPEDYLLCRDKKGIVEEGASNEEEIIRDAALELCLIFPFQYIAERYLLACSHAKYKIILYVGMLFPYLFLIAETAAFVGLAIHVWSMPNLSFVNSMQIIGYSWLLAQALEVVKVGVYYSIFKVTKIDHIPHWTALLTNLSVIVVGVVLTVVYLQG
eukprot:GFYU01008136.1.p1 GENE.GFYU01008136.1~~GFYU01008136.1.p1  ORF type:complete len:376 (-),score=130.81 GFYU01008136.1:92-1096(-)